MKNSEKLHSSSSEVDQGSFLMELSKVKDSTSLKIMGILLGGSIALGGCNFTDFLNGTNDRRINEYQSLGNDIEEFLPFFKEQYNIWHPNFDKNKVDILEQNKMQGLGNEIAYSLNNIPDLSKKVIIVDVDGATGVVVNEVLKQVGYNTTMNYNINWSNHGLNPNSKEIVNYDRLFSVLSNYPLTQLDKHHVDLNENGYSSKPWVYLLDYNRISFGKDQLNQSDDDNILYNIYGFRSEDLPNRVFEPDSNNKYLRDGVVLVTYKNTGINADVKGYLDNLSKNGTKTVDVIGIDGYHVIGLDKTDYKKYDTTAVSNLIKTFSIDNSQKNLKSDFSETLNQNVNNDKALHTKDQSNKFDGYPVRGETIFNGLIDDNSQISKNIAFSGKNVISWRPSRSLASTQIEKRNVNNGVVFVPIPRVIVH